MTNDQDHVSGNGLPDKEINITQEQIEKLKQNVYPVKTLFTNALNTLRYRVTRVPAYLTIIDRHKEGADLESKEVILNTSKSMIDNFIVMNNIKIAMNWLITMDNATSIYGAEIDEFHGTDWFKHCPINL